MQIIYPYNEVLPIKKAHDAYIIRQCACLAEAGHEVFLLIGQGSLDRKALFKFYKISPDNPLKIIYLPILRRKNVLRLQANALFFWFAQREIQKRKPDLVLFSVMKQAHFHLKKKIANCKYIYEVHQLRWYPTVQGSLDCKVVQKEREVLSKCDAITVTTYPLKEILQKAPYSLQNLIEKIPLACNFKPIQAQPLLKERFQLYYVGQLYLEQGLKILLAALQKVEGLTLNIVGGKPHEIDALSHLCQSLGLFQKVSFKGFLKSEDLEQEVQKADAFITTFKNEERMPYVAHTKLTEYQAWKRPIIAPDLEIVHEEVPEGALYFKADNEDSLIHALWQIQDPKIYQKLFEKIQKIPALSWQKRGCLFNKLLNKMLGIHEAKMT